MSDQLGKGTFDVGLNDLARDAHNHALNASVWQGVKSQQLGTMLLLLIKDLTKVMDEDIRGTLDQVSEDLPTITRFEEHMANVIIRLMDVSGAFKLDMEMATKLKMLQNANKTRR